MFDTYTGTYRYQVKTKKKQQNVNIKFLADDQAVDDLKFEKY